MRQTTWWWIASALTAILAGCGGGGGGNATTPANRPPISFAQASATTAYSSQSLQLRGAGSSDPDGSIVGYRWLQASGPAVTLSGADTVTATFTAPPVTDPATLSFTLTVTDNGGLSSSQSISISVAPADVQLILSVAGGKSFASDQRAVPLQLTDATLLGNPIAAANIQWSSSLQGSLGTQTSPATPLEVSLITGAHVLTVSADFGAQGTVSRTYSLRVLPFEQVVPAALASEMPGATYSMPVVMINVIPTQDGLTVDSSVTGSSGTSEWSPGSVEQLQAWIITYTTRAKFMLEEGSKFRGYKQPGTAPQLGYRVVAIYNFYQAFKPGKPDPGRAGNFFPDYFDLLDQIPTREFVEQQQVREFWVNSYHHGTMSLNESNMASSATGDVSNSYRTHDDLPLFSSTYVLYQNNYARSHAEAVHNHGHQIEAMLAYINQRYDGNTNLFWREFVGLDVNFDFLPGRCGATHWPLNARQDYDYNNSTDRVMSNCEDWQPAGGAAQEVSLDTWASIPYAWPVTGAISQLAESHWYIYWMQNLPGAGNTIPYNATQMENWWTFIGDWDAAIADAKRLYR
jgi:hypothetical protein